MNKAIQGLWQISDGHNHSNISMEEKDKAFFLQIDSYREKGLKTLDFGDIYLGVEARVGRYNQYLQSKNEKFDLKIHTKYVPDLNILANHQYKNAEKIVNRSLERMGLDQIDLVQFHWWDYEIGDYQAALSNLFELKAQGKIKEVGITNFNQNIVDQFIKNDRTPYSIQLQYSLLDRRPENGMLELCKANNIKVFCYGTVAGGFLSEKYLNKPEPKGDLENRSLIKYSLIIEEIGGWEKFQILLNLLAKIAEKYQTDIATIASAYILNQESIDAVIIGVRNTEHLNQHLKLNNLLLDKEDLGIIKAFLSDLPCPKGDVYDLERSGKHASIMHTSNNAK